MAPLKILIVGAGIAGPTLASFLLLSDLPAHLKPHITLLERSPRIRTQGQNIDIRGSGLTIIRKLGLETAIRASTTGEEGVEWVDRHYQVWGAFGADRTGKMDTPTADIEILRGRLAEICYLRSKEVSEQVQQEGGAGVEYLFGDYLSEIDQDGAQVHVRFAKSGDRRDYDLVVGADGLQSMTRNMVWGAEGEKDRVKRLGMYAGFFSMPRSKTDSQWRRWFHTSGRRGIMLRPDDSGEKTTVFIYVVSDTDDRFFQVATKGHAGVAEQRAILAEYFKDAGWESERVITEMNTAQDFYYDFVGQIHMDSWSKGRVVLLGDAGYCASPLSGMGTTLGLNGAYNLAGALLNHPNDHTAAFAEYEDNVRPIVQQAQKLAPGMPYSLCPETTWGLFLLHSFMYAIWQLNFVGVFIKHFARWDNKSTPIKDYGFKQLPEWQGYTK